MYRGEGKNRRSYPSLYGGYPIFFDEGLGRHWKKWLEEGGVGRRM